MAGLTHKLTEAWIAQDYFIWINDCEVREVDILDLEIMYGGCSVLGLLTIQDTQGHMNGAVPGAPSLKVGGTVRCTWTAAGGCGGEFDETFSVAKVRSETDEKNRRIVTIDLIDTETRNSSGTFLSKTYKDKKLSEIVEEHAEKIKPIITTSRKLKVTSHVREAKQHITIPSNVDAFTFMNTWLNEQGYARIKDKFTDYIVSKQTIDFNKIKSSEEEYEADPISEFSFWRILQYKLDGYDVNGLMDSIPTSLSDTSNSLNHNSKDKLGKSIAKTTHVKSAQPGIAKEGVVNKGTKSGAKNNANLQQYFNTLSNAQTCSIWVPGINNNKIGFKPIVNFPRPSYLAQEDYDEVFSGRWEVTAVRDKIIKQYFLQELFLRKVA